jgi:zinc protease
MFIKSTVFKKILLNGLTVLVDPVPTLPKVSMELLYQVGSREEESGEKGLAHLIEHMIFKGTERLSESDINVITHKLSGYTNAFTSHDATSYVFSFPAWNWKEGLVILADCMQNARFDEQMLNSELKAVIQELKMYNDRYAGTLVDQMLSLMFHDHPYHYPIIGFKQDLWSLKRDTLYNFYKKHYVPNNAILVVVGAVDPEDVFRQAEELFGSIPASSSYEKKEHYHGRDLVSKSVTLHRDVKHPICILGTLLPGATEGKQCS